MTPRQQLAGFLARYDPAIARIARATLRKMASRLPAAHQLVYDNYNALAIGFGPNERASDAIFSIAVFPRWVSLFFFNGVELPDPHRLLKGSGKQIRHIVLSGAQDLDDPRIRTLMTDALKRADPPLPTRGRGPVVIKSVSTRRRPRRPATAAASSRRR
jgi:hypothetical protein